MAVESKFAAVAGPDLIDQMIQKNWLIRLPSDSNKIAITAAGKAVLAESKGFSPTVSRNGKPGGGERGFTPMRRREMPGKVIGSEPRTALKHSVICPVCRKMFDVRDVAQAFEHMHGERPELLDTAAPGS